MQFHPAHPRTSRHSLAEEMAEAEKVAKAEEMAEAEEMVVQEAFHQSQEK